MSAEWRTLDIQQHNALTVDLLDDEDLDKH